MLNRLPIGLAQLQAGNNSDKLKNEIRELLYSLYRSKSMTKQVYKNLMNYIWIKKKQKKNNYQWEWQCKWEWKWDWEWEWQW